MWGEGIVYVYIYGSCVVIGVVRLVIDGNWKFKGYKFIIIIEYCGWEVDFCNEMIIKIVYCIKDI